MPYSEQVRPGARRARSGIGVVLALAAAAVIGVVLGYWTVPAPSSSTASFLDPTHEGRALPGPDPERLPGSAVTVDDGVVPPGGTVFDGGVPAVANLDPDLLGALRRAAADAAGGGVEFSVSSGWRSAAYQDQLLRDAVSEYGSEEEAARWVATSQTSLHVSGDAVDLGTGAAQWLSERGAAYGLCQTYRNEPWHYELRPDAVDDGCPSPYADPTDDPRMQQ
ncbi:MAG TPA: M15 family metallopeptidase [Blastococcus sp.]|nr:M15 family metallopeptidase [Blastococcus sp.]